ncbi:Zinc/iron permease [Lasiosphaeria miniovina]|uniref:Zinc/iron permease n=1 Tax=Lasiosphaeria miniovina TaxID=1954250 RepID=A0AA40DMY7_9PEZI|nr:Zinc/iron permease [Lasiosphaeria miniovina]KAK0709100.1 Zinc/iron permease [Lasiosphaeria miniovina]
MANTLDIAFDIAIPIAFNNLTRWAGYFFFWPSVYVVMALAIGIGILVGTSLIVIIPEGIEAIATTGMGAHSHSHDARHLGGQRGLGVDWESGAHVLNGGDKAVKLRRWESSGANTFDRVSRDLQSGGPKIRAEEQHQDHDDEDRPKIPVVEDDYGPPHMPTFYIGFSLMLGFVLMFLIDRLPRHATETFQAVPTTRHISLDDLAASSVSGEEEAEGFLGSLAPSPKQTRSLATTTGLVIHAAADGIAMGASATTSDMKLGLIIFVAIMAHKAPAAFGLTSVLLKQGLPKRAARGHLIVFSLAAPVGALLTYLIIFLIGGDHMQGEAGQWWTGMLLLFSAGTFLYVAMHAMQEENHSSSHEHHSSVNALDGTNVVQRKQVKPQMRDTLATVGGMLLPLLTQFGHHH